MKAFRMKTCSMAGIACPRCGVLNEIHDIQIPRSFNDEPFSFQCWNEAEKKGCLKDITLVAQITFSTLKPNYKELLANEEANGGV